MCRVPAKKLFRLPLIQRKYALCDTLGWQL